MTRCAVFGTGSWGTAISIVLADAGNEVVMCGRRAEAAAAINAGRENAEYFPGIRLPDAIRATADPAEALAGAEFAMLTVPAQSLRENLRIMQLAALRETQQCIVRQAAPEEE